MNYSAALADTITAGAWGSEAAIADGGPVLIECVIPEDDKVFPMVSPGGSISEAFDAADLAERGQEA